MASPSAGMETLPNMHVLLSTESSLISHLPAVQQRLQIAQGLQTNEYTPEGVLFRCFSEKKYTIKNTPQKPTEPKHITDRCLECLVHSQGLEPWLQERKSQHPVFTWDTCS